MENQAEVKPSVNVELLIECERRIEGLAILVGVLADAKNSAELEIIADELIGTVENMNRAINIHTNENVG